MNSIVIGLEMHEDGVTSVLCPYSVLMLFDMGSRVLPCFPDIPITQVTVII